MNILVLNGSPKSAHSNTMKLTKAFLEGFTQNQSADTDIVDIYKLNIRECLGCFSCWSKTPGKSCLLSWACLLHGLRNGIQSITLQAANAKVDKRIKIKKFYLSKETTYNRHQRDGRTDAEPMIL